MDERKGHSCVDSCRSFVTDGDLYSGPLMGGQAGGRAHERKRKNHR